MKKKTAGKIGCKQCTTPYKLYPLNLLRWDERKSEQTNNNKNQLKTYFYVEIDEWKKEDE